MEKYCISVDWLQVCCYGQPISVGEYKGHGRLYVVSDTRMQTAMFQTLLSVKVGGIEYASIQQEPRSSALRKELILIKLSNRILYSTRYIEILYDLMRTFHVQYKGITRLDLAYDCNHFFGHRNPSKFLNNFVMKPVKKIGAIVHVGTNQFRCNGSRSADANSKITSIQFGSKSKDVTGYIYDKTIELREVKDKPWIRDMWMRAGLISDDKTHVWRSEVSIKAGGTKILDLSTGELFRLSPDYLEHYDRIVSLFHTYANRALRFRVNSGQKNKRYFKDLQLYEQDCVVTEKSVSVNQFADTGRSEKICANKLRKLSEEYSNMSSYVSESLLTAIEFISTISGVKASIAYMEKQYSYLTYMKGTRFVEDDAVRWSNMIQATSELKRQVGMIYQESEGNESLEAYYEFMYNVAHERENMSIKPPIV